MPDTRYSYSVDLNDPTTSHSLAALLVPPGSTVLDIGAADGSIARALISRGCRVWAVEVNAAWADKARTVCERVIVGDVEQLDLETELGGKRFDVVLLLDVLEHLHDPLATLARVSNLLAPGGRIIASIPNVAHGAVRLSLMSGAFTYTETGLLDRTHLRFFDRRGAETLFRSAKLRIVERLRVTRGLTETEIPIQPSTISPQVLQMLESDDDATTYQFVFAAVPSEGVQVPETVSLAERLQRRTKELESQYLELQGYARSLEKEHAELRRVRGELESLLHTRARELDDSQAQLEVRMQELAQRDLELRHLRADLAVKEAFITHLRDSGDHLNAELRTLRVYADLAGFRIVQKFMAALSPYPRAYGFLRNVARRLSGRSRTS